VQIDYFNRVNDMGLKNRRMIGFGISNNATFSQACQYADGAIVGSAFIKLLSQDASNASIDGFIKSIKSTK
jgi:tryptophan synthase alpha chain